MENGQPLVLIAKITHSCNLKCKYCFYTKLLDSNSPAFLNTKDLKAILLKSSEHWHRISLVLHGGEPLLLPLSYFKEIIDYQKFLSETYDTIFRNSIQTNGTIFTEDICDFIKKEDIYFGVSIDGTRKIQNENRPLKNGGGSFETIIQNIRKFKKNGIKPSALVVATKQVIDEPESLYLLFKTEGIDFKVNELFPETTPPYLIPTPRELGEFYQKLFDLWFFDKNEPILRIRPFTTMIASFWSNKVGDCTYRSNCASFFVIETNGNVYSCARFNHSPGYRLGNILHQSWSDIKKSPIISKFNQRKNKLPPDCQKCSWLEQCWGGCAACALEARGSLFEKTRWCESRKHIFSHIKDNLESILNEEVYHVTLGN